MKRRLNVVDYNMDWWLKEYNLNERGTPGGVTTPGVLTTPGGGVTREEAIAYCGTLEVGGIEVMHAYWQDCDPEYVVGLAEDAGIPIRTYIFSCDLAVPPDERDRSVDEAKGMIDRAVAMGAGLGMIIPGFAKSQFPIQEQVKWMVEGLSLCAEYAGRSGLTLASENVDAPASRPLMGRSDECIAICQQVGSPHYRLIFDAAPAIYVGQEPVEALLQMLPYVVHVHLKNIIRVTDGQEWQRTVPDEQGCVYRGVLLDQGVVDLPAILKKLREHDYQGDFLIEYQGEEDPRNAMLQDVACARDLLKEAGFAG